LKEKKKVKAKNLVKEKKLKEEPKPYTQAQLLKNRNEVLSRMPLHEALYRRAIGGKKQTSPVPENSKTRGLDKSKIKIQKSTLKTNRDGSLNGKYNFQYCYHLFSYKF
jgi:hypothetical protein